MASSMDSAHHPPPTNTMINNLQRRFYLAALALALLAGVLEGTAESRLRTSRGPLLKQRRRWSEAGTDMRIVVKSEGHHNNAMTTSCSHMCNDTSLPTGLDGACDFNLMEDKAYLPDSDFLRCTARHPSPGWARERRELREYAERLQNPRDCAEAGKGWRLLTLRNCGFGSSIAEAAAGSVLDAWAHGEAGE